MKRTISILFLFILYSCSSNPKDYIPYLNGYWEIEEVILPDGSKREYGFNDTIDFMDINDSLVGYRKKMKPNFDGTFSTSDDIETLNVVVENDSLNIYYTTLYSKWKETVLEATENRLVVQNLDKIRYVYKRYKPFDLN